MMKKILIFLFLTLGCALTACAAVKKFTLVIDAGHGGIDPGALGSFSKEKNVALTVAKAFGSYVERNCPDVKVVYTRKTDVSVSLKERANIANRNKADLFVSIHCNALPKGKISRGMETYTLGMHRAGDNFDVAKRENEVILYEEGYKQRYAGFDPRSSESYIIFELMQDNNMLQSVEMAKLVQQKTCATANRSNKGVKQAGFLVLRETSMPSCLVELGFITTPDEERMMNSKTGVDAMARGLYQAFVAYKKKASPTSGIPYKPDPAPQEVEIPQIVPKADPVAKPRQAVAKKQPATEPAARQEQPAAETRTETPKDTIVVNDTIVVVQTETLAEPRKAAEEPQEQPAGQQAGALSAPVFKVQILASTARLKAGNAQLKGEAADCYEEGGMFKYTVGASANYAEVYQLRKRLVAKFPEAFIVAFRDGVKMNVNEAISEYRANKQKK